jgi:hypothetical protein
VICPSCEMPLYRPLPQTCPGCGNAVDPILAVTRTLPSTKAPGPSQNELRCARCSAALFRPPPAECPTCGANLTEGGSTHTVDASTGVLVAPLTRVPPYRNPRVFVPVGVCSALFVGLLIVGAIVGPQDKATTVSSSRKRARPGPPPTAQVSQPPTTARTTTTRQPTTTVPPIAPPTTAYLGQSSHDHGADAKGVVSWTHHQAATTGWQPDGEGQICGAVAVHNPTSKRQSYNAWDWKLQSPLGHAETPTFGGTLSAGDLAPGGTVKGTLCFTDSDERGHYAVIWQPDAFSSDRGVWLFAR